MPDSVALGRNTTATHPAIRASLHLRLGKILLLFIGDNRPTRRIFSQKRQPLSAKARPGCDHSFFPYPAGQGQGGDSARRSRPRTASRDAGCDNVRVSWEGRAEPEAIECVRLHAMPDKTASSAWSRILGGVSALCALERATRAGSQCSRSSNTGLHDDDMFRSAVRPTCPGIGPEADKGGRGPSAIGASDQKHLLEAERATIRFIFFLLIFLVFLPFLPLLPQHYRSWRSRGHFSCITAGTSALRFCKVGRTNSEPRTWEVGPDSGNVLDENCVIVLG
ncbi:hypothetical protein EDB83DRAFT_733610 [Lactarius deliciosus]|nr:hypothetical protein EDB83DRAFT_733610 [Lactarius deliciosus]